MSHKKQKVLQSKDLLTVCLAKAFDESLTVKMGPGWFQTFLEEDKTQKPEWQIARNNQASVWDLDMQALLKILRHRPAYCKAVMSYFGFDYSRDPYIAQDNDRQFQKLLDNLITDFRNCIEAHSRAADIQMDLQNQKVLRVYGYDDAMRDIVKLASFFPTVRNKKGQYYYDKILRLSRTRFPVWGWISIGAVAALAAVVVLALTLWPSSQSIPDGPTSGNVFYKDENIVFEQNHLTIRPKQVFYYGDTIVAKCYILNGLNKTVTDLRVLNLTFSDETGILCSAGFGELEDVQIYPQSYTEWTFVFPRESVYRTDGALTRLQQPLTKLEYSS